MRNRILTVFALGLVAALLFAANTTQVAVAQQITAAASPAATSAPTAQPTPDPFAYKAYDASHFGPCPTNWVPLFKPDPVLYPYKDNCFQHDLGTIHYVDEGPKDAPETILFVQGNPNWSFMFHDAMNYMIGKGYRVLAVDQFGFGLSDSLPLDRFDYTPRHQSYILEELVTGLNLTHITLVVHDWGGPIGLGMAGREPDRIARLIINNTTGFALDLNAPGYISRGAQWGTIAAKNQSAIIAQCLVPKQAATEEAYAYDPTQGDLYKRIYAMTIAGFLDANGKPLHTWSCAPPVLMPASIVNDPTYIPQVEANLTKLVGKPYSLVYTAGDQIFGEMHADMTDPKNPACPPPLQPVCDQVLFGPDRTCDNQRTNPLNDGWVCRMADGTQVFPYADKFKAVLGQKALYFFATSRLERHWIGSHEVSRSLVRTALDELIQVAS